MNPKVSVVIPTCNRPELVPRAIRSVLAQTFQDFEIIVVDDGDKMRAEEAVRSFGDPRIRYIRHDPPKRGGSAARNTGIAAARGKYVGFLDDDDEWASEKLAVQVERLGKTDGSVGFSVTQVRILRDGGVAANPVMEGVRDFLPLLLTRFKGFLTSTLVVKRGVFDDVGVFDESFPSHQESELLLRIAAKYKGLAINSPLVTMDGRSTHEHISSDMSRRISGREMLLEKHRALYEKHPRQLAKHYFWLGLWCRDSMNGKKAMEYFWRSFRLSANPRYLLHALAASLKYLFARTKKPS